MCACVTLLIPTLHKCLVTGKLVTEDKRLQGAASVLYCVCGSVVKIGFTKCNSTASKQKAALVVKVGNWDQVLALTQATKEALGFIGPLCFNSLALKCRLCYLCPDYNVSAQGLSPLLGECVMRSLLWLILLNTN